MRIIAVHSENFMRLHAVHILPNRNVVRITGENGAGKSAVLNAIFCALVNAKHHPSQPIREGANKATIHLDLGENDVVEFRVIRRFTPSGIYLDVETPNGARFPSPQALLDTLIGALSFDPLAFSRLKPREQLEQLRSVVTVDVDLDQLDADSRAAYEKRTIVNREVTSLAERTKMLADAVHDTYDVEPIDVSAMMTQLQEAANHNSEVKRLQVLRQDQRRRQEEMQAEMTRITQEIAALQARFEQVETEHAGLSVILSRAVIPDSIDTALLRIAIDDANAENGRKKDEVRARTRHATAVRELAIATEQADALTGHINALAATKADAIAAAEMPVEGLSFGDGEITYRGQPFAQASSAEQIRVATAIGMALNPKLRLLCIRDGSLLDTKSFALLEEMAEAHDFQVWVEMVNPSPTMGIHMVDGSVAAIDGVPVTQDEDDVAELTPVGA